MLVKGATDVTSELSDEISRDAMASEIMLSDSSVVACLQ